MVGTLEKQWSRELHDDDCAAFRRLCRLCSSTHTIVNGTGSELYDRLLKQTEAYHANSTPRFASALSHCAGSVVNTLLREGAEPRWKPWRQRRSVKEALRGNSLSYPSTVVSRFRDELDFERPGMARKEPQGLEIVAFHYDLRLSVIYRLARASHEAARVLKPVLGTPDRGIVCNLKKHVMQP